MKVTVETIWEYLALLDETIGRIEIKQATVLIARGELIGVRFVLDVTPK